MALYTHTHTHTSNLKETIVGAAPEACPFYNDILQNNHAITLSVLIVTVVILIILAGVTINIATKDNGIIDKSKETVNEYQGFVAQQQAYMDAKEEELKTGVDPNTTEKLKTFITEWTVEAGDEIVLPIVNNASYSYDFDVDYGDGSKYHITSATDENRKHTYKESRTYTVKISGKCECFSFYDVEDSKLTISKLVQWGEIGVKTINFSTCSNLEGTIPKSSENTFANMDGIGSGAVSRLFLNCTKLTGSIPDNLFQNYKGKTAFAIFAQCTGLTGSIPEDLFSDCVNIEYFGATFQSCTGLTGSIPKDLFVNCTKVTNFQTTFNGCSGLTGGIPENLFSNCTKVTTFTSTFQNCRGLTGSIPEDLFANCIEVTNFQTTFRGCTGLTGNAPALWDTMVYPNVTVSTQCFGYCTNLSNYASIPDGWK